MVLERILLIQVFALLTAFSGAVGKGTETRSYQQNRKMAFLRMIETPTYQSWVKKELARRQGISESEEEILEVIKSYNFKDNRITNHRTGEKTHDLKEVLDGLLTTE